MRELLKEWASSCVLWDQSTFFPLPYIPLVSNTNCTHLFTHSWMQACPAHCTAVHKSWRWSTTQTFHSPQTTIQLHILMFSKERRFKKKALSQWGCHLTLLCFRISYCPVGRHVWTPESEFLMTHSKAKSTVPKQSAALRTEERGGSDLTVLRGTNDGSRIWSRNMAARKNPFVTQTLKFVTSVASFAPKRHKQAGYLCGISGATHQFPHPSHRQPLRMIHTFLFSSLHFEQRTQSKIPPSLMFLHFLTQYQVTSVCLCWRSRSMAR